jgi:hypothetical protein
MHHDKFCPDAQDESTTDLTDSDLFLRGARFPGNADITIGGPSARALRPSCARPD